MKIITNNPDLLILQYQRSWIMGLVIGTIFCLVGLFFVGFGALLFKQQSLGVSILPGGMGSIFFCTGVAIWFQYPKIVKVTFDRVREHILWEQKTFSWQSVTKSIEIPSDSIVGVEIVTSDDMDAATGYYPRLILDRLYWRIPLDTNGYERTGKTVAKSIADFLNVPYFLDKSIAPIQPWEQRYSKREEKMRYGWQYFEDEVERLQQHLSQNPQDAQAHEDLATILYLSGRLHRRSAIEHFHQAENLFLEQDRSDLATITRIVRSFVSYSQVN
jgi:hypothetical protein